MEKVFYSDHIAYCFRSEKKNYSLMWVNKNYRCASIHEIAFKKHYGWMIKDGYLYDLKDRYDDGMLAPYKYKQITEEANVLFQGSNNITENEKIIIVESKNVPDMMQQLDVHHYIPMFDGYAYSLNDSDNGRLECWKIVDEVEIKKNETPETPLDIEFHADEFRFPMRNPFMPVTNTVRNEQVRLDRVVYNDPATIVFWSDGTKTVVKCSPKDTYDPEKGLLLCIAKKTSDNGDDWYKKLQEKLPETPAPKMTAIHDKKLLSIHCDAPLTNVSILYEPIMKKINEGYNNFEFKGHYAGDILRCIIALADK